MASAMRNATATTAFGRRYNKPYVAFIGPWKGRWNQMEYRGYVAARKNHLITTKRQPIKATTTTRLVTSIAHTEADFFGEPISFLENPSPDAIEKFNAYLVSVVSKGKSASNGGDEAGIAVKAAHANAIVWADLLKRASSSPMMMAASVTPLVAQAGTAYLHIVDKLLVHVGVSLRRVAEAAIKHKDHPDLSTRELLHLSVLDHLLRNERAEALSVLLKLLQQCPGDAYALSLAIDIASVEGNKDAAMSAAGTVASYWRERKGYLAGYSIGSSLIALGFAAGGRFADAERLTEVVMHVDSQGCGGISTWALANIYDAEGRTSEGISWLAGYDGVSLYEQCGFLFFHTKLSGYGALFAMEREGAGEGRTSLRMFDSAFDPILEYSGYDVKQPWESPQRRAPTRQQQRIVESGKEGAKNLLQSIFGGGGEEDKENGEEEPSSTSTPKAELEDVLTWLPPTPQVLEDATWLLLRLVFNGSISGSDTRWVALKNSWETHLEASDSKPGLSPSAALAACLLCHPDDVPSPSDAHHDVRRGVHLLGSLLRLAEPTSENDDDKEVDPKPTEWKEVVDLISPSSVSMEHSSETKRLLYWDVDSRTLYEHAICYAACMSEDYEALCRARSICSKGVALRMNSPEEWWRYSIVLDRLGDGVAAEDARTASISLGSGEGGFFGEQ